MPEQVSVPTQFNPQKGGPSGVTNAERAEKAFRLLGTMPRGGEHDEYLAAGQEEGLIDLLADLLHLCDREDWDFEQAMALARKHHAEER